MFSFGVKRTEDLETFRDITDDVEESDFVPYTCHYNPHTLLTKNGELLQILKVVGLDHEKVGHEDVDFRDTIRSALRECVHSSSFAFWFHTIRCKVDLSTSGEYQNDFAREVNEAWEQKNQFKKQFVNEVYITIVHEGQDVSITGPQNFVKGLLPSIDIKWRNDYIDNMYLQLNSLVDDIEQRMNKFGVQRLGIIEEQDGIYYSEPCAFLEKLINLEERPMPLVEQDLSWYLTSGEITFGFNAMEVRMRERRRFASILTIKECKEASLGIIDKFLKQPIEFIATQCVDFINSEDALEHYREQKMLTDLSGDYHLSELTEVESVLRSHTSHVNDFGQQQLTLFILADSIKELEQNVRDSMQFLHRYGVLSVREDLRFEECYWAQLPGNFEFIRRLYPTSIDHICGFTNLHNYPAGKKEENHWGPAVSTFHTAAGTPYFFNFHDGVNGLTSIAGVEGSGKSVLTNFLVSQAMKFNPKVRYIDVHGNVSHFLEKIGGHYHHLQRAKAQGHDHQTATHTPAGDHVMHGAFDEVQGTGTVQTPETSTSAMPLNPFSLPATPGNKDFLVRWLSVLIRMGDKELTEDIKQQLPVAVERLYQLPEGQRHFMGYMQIISELCPSAQAAFDIWLPDGEYGHVFNHTQDVFNQSVPILGLGLSDIMSEAKLIIPVFAYVIERITTELDGSPTVLVIDEAWKLLKNSHVASHLSEWCQVLQQKNVVGIFTLEKLYEVAEEPICKLISQEMATQIFLPDEHPTSIYQDVFGLNATEYEYLDIMDTEERHFMLKRKEETIVAELNLAGMNDIINILSNKKNKM